jgi:hypothetical protein
MRRLIPQIRRVVAPSSPWSVAQQWTSRNAVRVAAFTGAGIAVGLTRYHRHRERERERALAYELFGWNEYIAV